MTTQEKSVRDRLIEAGLKEINKNGTKNFSVRRIAASCGVSCAAPYKHFQNKDDFMAAIVEYAKELWINKQRKIIDEHSLSSREQILLICRAYIQFLVENPYFRSILMSKDESFDSEHLTLKSRVTEATSKIVGQYCKEVGMPENVHRIKLFIVRSILYGAALMLDNGEMPNTPEIMDEIVNVIDREFDLP